MADMHRTSGGIADAGDDQELVTCVLGNVELGLDINAVQEIVRLPRITPVPRAPSYVEGVTNLRGNVLPIINSRTRFGMPPSECQENSRVVVVELNGIPTGLIVDAVREVMHVSPRDIEAAPPVVHSVDGRFLKGIVKLDGGQRLVLLLDHDAVLQGGDLQTDQTTDRSYAGGRSDEARAAGKEDDHEQLVTFRLADEEYGIPITDVQEIIRVPRISPIPNAPPGVIGIASLRNRILPVVDLRTKFGFRALQEETEAFCQRIRSFEQEHQEVCARLQTAVCDNVPFERTSLRAFRDFERWHAGFVTADRLVQALLAPVSAAFRTLAEAVRRTVPLVESGARQTAKQELTEAVRPAHARLALLLEKLHVGISRRDDERCLVVHVGGKSLALRVDAVNQVLQAPKAVIESTPSIVTAGGGTRDQIRGIAKLDGGKRLIMLLAADRLVSRAELQGMDQMLEGQSTREETHGQEAAEEEERQLVSFRVAGEEFAVDIMQVQEIIRLERVTRVPQTPAYVEGIVNLRGNVLPVIDLRKRVNMSSKDYNDSTRVVVVDLQGRKTGIIVDAVSEVMRVSRRSIEPAPAIVKSSYGDHFIEGVGKLNKGERMFLLLRADQLLGEADLALSPQGA